MSRKIVSILLPLPKLFPLSYYIPTNCEPKLGNLVVVPFKNKKIVGIVWGFDDSIRELKNIKYIEEIIFPEIILTQELLSLISKASNYYLAELGSIAKLVLPVALENKPPKKIQKKAEYDDLKFDINNINLPLLSLAQEQALTKIKEATKPVVLKGITGSGKTEVYFHLILEYIKAGKQCLIMLPEISLSTQVIQRFIAKFDFEPIVWNSSVTKGRKQKSFERILKGEAKVIIGARSSLFLPYKDLGLIIVDEEHDGAYKQEDNILYNARDMAVLRGSLAGSKTLLCSATPSIETIYNVNINKYQLVELSERYNNAKLPQVEIIDMRKQKLSANKWISPVLYEAINNTLENSQQVLLFLNRRGYSPLLICRSCGFRVNCPNCTSWLVLHKAAKKLECHHCGYIAAIPTNCRECKSEHSFYSAGPGIERVEEEIKGLFPDKKIAIMSKEQTKKMTQAEQILDKMSKGEIDILIGTQIVTKGYHFPNLTLVGVIDADLGFNNIDLKSAERTFQLLYQVGGRAGRADKPGYLMLQTYNANSTVFDNLKNHEIDEFINHELENRQIMSMPPLSKMASLLLSDKEEERLFVFAKNLVKLAPIGSDIKILGPARALMTKLAGKYRYRIIIIVNKKFPLQNYLNTWLSNVKIPTSIHIKIDIDPQNLS